MTWIDIHGCRGVGVWVDWYCCFLVISVNCEMNGFGLMYGERVMVSV